MSDIFEKVGRTLSDTGRAVSEKTKQVGDVVRLNAKIISEERSISDNYVKIGKTYYDNFSDNPSPDFEEAVNAITASIDAIKDMKTQILAIRGMVKCAECGANASSEDSFCGKCGAKLEKPEPKEEDEIIVEVVEDIGEDVSDE